MPEDDPLYPRAILRLAADAAGAGRLPCADAVATVHNPVCGDRITIELALTEGQVTALAHATQACVLTQASASVLATRAPGTNRAGLLALRAQVHSFLLGGAAPPGFEAFAGMASHAGRHVCVLLPFEAALKALELAEPSASGTQAQART